MKYWPACSTCSSARAASYSCSQAALRPRRRLPRRPQGQIIKAQRLAVDEGGEVLVWVGAEDATPAPAHDQERFAILHPNASCREDPEHPYCPRRWAQLVTALFADIKGSTELIAGLERRGPTLLDAALHAMMAAVHLRNLSPYRTTCVDLEYTASHMPTGILSLKRYLIAHLTVMR